VHNIVLGVRVNFCVLFNRLLGLGLDIFGYNRELN